MLKLRKTIIIFLAAALAACVGSYADSGMNRFDDVPASAWYGDAVEWAVEEGVADGTGQRYLFTRRCVHPRADRHHALQNEADGHGSAEVGRYSVGAHRKPRRRQRAHADSGGNRRVQSYNFPRRAQRQPRTAAWPGPNLRSNVCGTYSIRRRPARTYFTARRPEPRCSISSPAHTAPEARGM